MRSKGEQDEKENNDVANAELTIVSYDEETNQGIAFVTAKSNITGHINGNGVRLRAQPSTSAPILGVMYQGEMVRIYMSESNGGWYKVVRVQNSTSGWVARSYVTIN